VIKIKNDKNALHLLKTKLCACTPWRPRERRGTAPPIRNLRTSEVTGQHYAWAALPTE